MEGKKTLESDSMNQQHFFVPSGYTMTSSSSNNSCMSNTQQRQRQQQQHSLHINTYQVQYGISIRSYNYSVVKPHIMVPNKMKKCAKKKQWHS